MAAVWLFGEPIGWPRSIRGRQHGGIITQSCLTKVILLGQSLVFVGGCGRSMSDRTSTGLTREYLSVRSTMAHEYRTRGTEVTRECMSA